MNAVGIIAEYNPFHKGHAYHIEQAKKSSQRETVVVVMSGSFVQRGEPALFDKWLRAKMALCGGADLIIELPTVFALRSAQYFAEGAISLLHRLGSVSHVCFGAETPDEKQLSEAAKMLDDPHLSKLLSERMRNFGLSYAAALAELLTAELDFSLSPNNILAIEYMRAIRKLAPTLKPLPILRTTEYHNVAINQPIVSASAIRQALYHKQESPQWQETLPTSVLTLIQHALQENSKFPRLENLSLPLLTLLRTHPPHFFHDQAEITEGLEYKIQKAAKEATSWDSFFAKIMTKRYPPAKLRRILLYLLLNVSQKTLQKADEQGPLYSRVLAFNDQGRCFLREAKHTASIPFILKTAQFLASNNFASDLSPLQQMLSIDIAATDIYNLSFPETAWQSGGQDYRRSPYYQRKRE
ncbi:MAG: nucleotidyltransferase [Sporomusaceae bacterium]|nr:nucleotidyltransferase [Sporomusaceae bacterium]